MPTLLTILGMALMTYTTRAAGLWLMGRIPVSPRIEAGLAHIPGAILTALLAPIALAGGQAEAMAMAVTILIAARTKNILLAMTAGVGLVWLLRGIGF